LSSIKNTILELKVACSQLATSPFMLQLRKLKILEIKWLIYPAISREMRVEQLGFSNESPKNGKVSRTSSTKKYTQVYRYSQTNVGIECVQSDNEAASDLCIPTIWSWALMFIYSVLSSKPLKPLESQPFTRLLDSKVIKDVKVLLHIKIITKGSAFLSNISNDTEGPHLSSEDFTG
jgi:hypothetical protein